MMSHPARPVARNAVRRAFTLVEILVVIAIIGILLTVITIASVRALAGARVNQTRTTIKKIDEILSSRMAAFDRAMTGRNLSGGDTTSSELLTKYDYIADTSMKAKWLKVKFFGTAFGEPTAVIGSNVWWAADLGVAERAELDASDRFDPGKHQAITENPEMLYWIITNGPTFGSDVQADFNSSEVADTDGDGLMEFIDAWGRPIRFYRWPTRLIRPGPPSSPAAQGSPYQSLGPDADSNGRIDDSAPATFLISALPSYTTSGDSADPTLRPDSPLGHDSEDALGEVFLDYMRLTNQSNAVVASQSFENLFHTVNTWHAPLIVSAGPDGVLGLFEPTDRDHFGHLAQPMPNAAGTGYSEELQDNVTNLNGQSSGTGGS